MIFGYLIWVRYLLGQEKSQNREKCFLLVDKGHVKNCSTESQAKLICFFWKFWGIYKNNISHRGKIFKWGTKIFT